MAILYYRALADFFKLEKKGRFRPIPTKMCDKMLKGERGDFGALRPEWSHPARSTQIGMECLILQFGDLKRI
jgi:hypothetical protein